MVLSRRKKLLFTGILVAFAFAMVEAGVRIVFAMRVGPSVLFYGLRAPRQETTVSVWDPDNNVGRYTKFRPHQVRFDNDSETQVRFTVTINSRGFRGKEFSDAKKPGVVRVISLGESSTFGFYARDDQTYPYYMEELLNAQCHGRVFEVLNFGIPHLRSNHILALFLAEAVQLEPDVITYYQGSNENNLANEALPPPQVRADFGVSWLGGKIFALARSNLLSVAFVHSLVSSAKPEQFSEGEVRAHTEALREPFIRNVSRIQQESQRRGIVFIAATQQMQSLLIRDREELRRTPFDVERGIVKQKLARDGSLTYRERSFYAQGVLMDDLRHWASTHRVPLLDLIRVLDPERDVLVNWVHLRPRGNELIAAAFSKEILTRVCAHPVGSPKKTG